MRYLAALRVGWVARRALSSTGGGGSNMTNAKNDGNVKILSAKEIMEMSANRATRYVYLRTLPLKQEHAIPRGEIKNVAATIEARVSDLCDKHAATASDDRAAIHLHTTALAIATHRVLSPYVKDDIRVCNAIRAGFGAPLAEHPAMSDEEKLVLNDGQSMRPDYWVIRAALWFAFDKLSAIRKMTANMTSDFGPSFETHAVDDNKAGLTRHVLYVKKCFYHDLCKREGLPHLTKVFCALDRQIFSPINTSRHKIRFTLDKTLADIDSSQDDESSSPAQCEFKFVKIK